MALLRKSINEVRLGKESTLYMLMWPAQIYVFIDCVWNKGYRQSERGGAEAHEGSWVGQRGMWEWQ